MKNILSILLLSSSIISACTDTGNTQQANQTTTDTTQSVVATTPENIDECYQYVSGKDSVLMHITKTDNEVIGDLTYSFFEKDNNTGTFKGQMKGDTIFADYTFMSEGRESVREIALLKKGDNLVEGYGDVKEEGTKMVFTNRSTLNFDKGITLTKTTCK